MSWQDMVPVVGAALGRLLRAVVLLAVLLVAVGLIVLVAGCGGTQLGDLPDVKFELSFSKPQQDQVSQPTILQPVILSAPAQSLEPPVSELPK